MNEELQKLISILCDVSEGRKTCKFAEQKCNEINWEALADYKNVYTNLFHYWLDEDIREKDSNYQAFQNKELANLIVHLKYCDFAKASEISFLQ